MSDLVTCPACGSKFDLEVDSLHWANLAEEWMCESCYENESQYASTVLLFGPNWESNSDGPQRIYVTSRFSTDQWGDEPQLAVSRTYHPTDGWRGYHVTHIDGWVDVGLEGWTTGGWDDPIARRKQDFNNWVERLVEGKVTPPVDVAVAMDPTSNVFSTAITVYVPEGSRDAFDQWLNGDRDVLYESLG